MHLVGKGSESVQALDRQMWPTVEMLAGRLPLKHAQFCAWDRMQQDLQCNPSTATANATATSVQAGPYDCVVVLTGGRCPEQEAGSE